MDGEKRGSLGNLLEKGIKFDLACRDLKGGLVPTNGKWSGSSGRPAAELLLGMVQYNQQKY